MAQSASSSSSANVNTPSAPVRVRVVRYWHGKVRMLSITNAEYSTGYEHLTMNAFFVVGDLQKLLRGACGVGEINLQEVFGHTSTKALSLFELRANSKLYALVPNGEPVFVATIGNGEESSGIDIYDNGIDLIDQGVPRPVILVPSGLLHDSCRYLKKLIGPMYPELTFYESPGKIIGSFSTRSSYRDWTRDSTLVNGEKIWLAHYENSLSCTDVPRPASVSTIPGVIADRPAHASMPRIPHIKHTPSVVLSAGDIDTVMSPVSVPAATLSISPIPFPVSPVSRKRVADASSSFEPDAEFDAYVAQQERDIRNTVIESTSVMIATLQQQMRHGMQTAKRQRGAGEENELARLKAEALALSKDKGLLTDEVVRLRRLVAERDKTISQNGDAITSLKRAADGAMALLRNL